MSPSRAMAQSTISAAAIAAAPLLMLISLSSAGGEAAAADPSPTPTPIGMPGCVTSCGDVEVPYPFGLGPDNSCYLPGFNLTCDNTAGSSPRLLLDADGTLQVLDIIVDFPHLRVQHNGDVKIKVDADGNGNGTFSHSLSQDGPYTLDPNIDIELILTGCNVQATVKSSDGVTMASCTSLCDDTERDESSANLRCFGASTGCCRANIVFPVYDDDDNVGMSAAAAYDVQLIGLGHGNLTADLERFPVRVFIALPWWFGNSSISNDLLQTSRPLSKEAMAAPVLLTWDIFGQPNTSVCKSNHSEHFEGTRRGGYRCHCNEGYNGNPYLPDGCKDDNECEGSQEDNSCYGVCINTDRSFKCRCPPGTAGDHTIPGGCVNTTVAATGAQGNSDDTTTKEFNFGLLHWR